jgi:hypothetical protein
MSPVPVIGEMKAWRVANHIADQDEAGGFLSASYDREQNVMSRFLAARGFAYLLP